MQYKTIALELLGQRPELYESLRQQRKLLASLEFYAEELKTSHEKWRRELSRAKPGSDSMQLASEALELAVEDLQNRLSSERPQDEEAVSAETAMPSLRRHTPRE